MLEVLKWTGWDKEVRKSDFCAPAQKMESSFYGENEPWNYG